MSRAADYTIKGFLYQFNKTLLEILNSNLDSTITVEGIVEDVEIVTPPVTTAIQCKYHEASESFQVSATFKPLLQMMCHFQTHPTANIRYVLFAHFPSVTAESQPKIAKADLQSALGSKNKDFKSYIDALSGKIDLDTFLTRFAIEFGPTYDTLAGQACAALKANGIPEADIDTLAYPNAINFIAQLSVKHDSAQRTITKQQFLAKLKGIRKIAISRWTLALRTRQQVLEAKRKELKANLDKNSRLRYLIVHSASIDDYATGIVLFLSDYLDKYHFKTAHINTPVLCLCTSESDFREIEYRLYLKGVISTDGYVGTHFDESRFFREPLFGKSAAGTLTREFSLRMLRWEDNGKALNSRKCDDLFLIGEPDIASLDTDDMNVEHLSSATLKEVKYLMGVSNVYE